MVVFSSEIVIRAQLSLVDVSLTMIPYDVTMMSKESSNEFEAPGQQNYHSFLLRLWRNQEIKESSWHFSLENPKTRAIQAFNDFESLCLYLTQIMGLMQAEQSLLEKKEE